MFGPLLVNKNILVDRSRHDNVRLWSRVDDKRMGYTVVKGFKRGFSKFYNPLSGTNPIETDLD